MKAAENAEMNGLLRASRNGCKIRSMGDGDGLSVIKSPHINSVCVRVGAFCVKPGGTTGDFVPLSQHKNWDRGFLSDFNLCSQKTDVES